MLNWMVFERVRAPVIRSMVWALCKAAEWSEPNTVSNLIPFDVIYDRWVHDRFAGIRNGPSVKAIYN